jgi:hypothetical protein
MRWFGLVCATALALALSATAAAASSGGGYVLTSTTSSGAAYAPTFTGNGYLGVRIPASGQGYAGGSVPAQSELAGFYAKPTHPKTISDAVQQRANIPTWSTLSFGDGSQTFSLTSGEDDRLAAVDQPSHGNRHHVGDLERAGRPHRRVLLPGLDRSSG